MRIGKPLVLKWSAVAVVVLVAIVGAFYIGTHSQQIKQQVSLATSRQPEDITELYFTDLNIVPTAVKPGQSVPVHFIIHNLEHQPLDYNYTITFSDAKGTIQLLEATTHINTSQSQTISHDVVVPQGTGRGKVSVQLTNKSQSVHYWLERI